MIKTWPKLAKQPIKMQMNSINNWQAPLDPHPSGRVLSTGFNILTLGVAFNKKMAAHEPLLPFRRTCSCPPD